MDQVMDECPVIQYGSKKFTQGYIDINGKWRDGLKDPVAHMSKASNGASLIHVLQKQVRQDGLEEYHETHYSLLAGNSIEGLPSCLAIERLKLSGQ